MTRAWRKDGNHADIRDGLRATGARVLDLAAWGVTPDLLARRPWWPAGTWLGLEVKAEGGRLSDGQKAMLAEGELVVVRSLEQALAALDAGVECRREREEGER